jgi:hypothetical protein
VSEIGHVCESRTQASERSRCQPATVPGGFTVLREAADTPKVTVIMNHLREPLEPVNGFFPKAA